MIWPNQPCKSKCKSLNPPHMTTSLSQLAHISMAYFTVLGSLIDWSGGPAVLTESDILAPGSPGGGGHSHYILVGVCRGTSKKGGLRHGHNPKKGGLRHGQNQKGGGVLGTGTSRKNGSSAQTRVEKWGS